MWTAVSHPGEPGTAETWGSQPVSWVWATHTQRAPGSVPRHRTSAGRVSDRCLDGFSASSPPALAAGKPGCLQAPPARGEVRPPCAPSLTFPARESTYSPLGFHVGFFHGGLLSVSRV